MHYRKKCNIKFYFNKFSNILENTNKILLYPVFISVKLFHINIRKLSRYLEENSAPTDKCRAVVDIYLD